MVRKSQLAEYIEIDNPKEIRRLNNTLSSILKRSLPYKENRTIGYPQDKFDARVQFVSPVGSDVFYWSPGLSKDKSTVSSFFGHGTPGAAASLNIDVQFNLPVVKFSRSMGGAFLRQLSSNEVILAHRGIVTLGHGRVSKAD